MAGTPNKDHVSFTEVSTFLRCRRLWGYRYYHRLRPNVPSKNLLLGSAVHRALAKYYAQDTPEDSRAEATITTYYEAVRRELEHLVEVTDEQPPDTIVEALDLGGDMIVQYLAWAPSRDTWEPKGVEVKFSVPVVDGLDLVGYIDLLARDPTEDVSWVVDHKTYAQLPPLGTDEQFFDFQGTVYMWALAHDSLMWSKKFVGITYNVLLKHKPKFPEQLKRGGLSKNKAQRTTPELYMQRVHELGLNPADYTDFVALLDPDKFNRRIPIRVSNRRLFWFDSQIKTLTHMIANTHEAGEIAFVPTVSRQCNYCDCAPLCKLAFEGYDWRTADHLPFYIPKKHVESTVVEDDDA